MFVHATVAAVTSQRAKVVHLVRVMLAQTETRFSTDPLHPRQALSDPVLFESLARSTIDACVQSEEYETEDDFRFARNTLLSQALACSDAIGTTAKSPLEVAFTRSLVLSFLRRGECLLVHATDRDAISAVAAFRETVQKFIAVSRKFRDRSDRDLRDFLHANMSGALPWAHRQTLLWSLMKYHHAPLDRCIHMTLQPRFSDILASGAIRPDLYFWSPAHPDLNVIVECDGYAYHSSHEKFMRDRKRDRAFHYRGFDVLRFGSTEVMDDPIGTAQELARYLSNRVQDAVAAG